MKPASWNILYRGPLSSCNYSCWYCPFAKKTNTAAELEDDRHKLERFCAWVAARPEEISVLFTPWGEALIHRSYQRALVKLSHSPRVRRVAIQTNLSGPIDWISECNPEAVALWTTFHPSQTSVEKFLGAAHRLDSAGIRFSVGVVGIKESFAALQELRSRLPRHIYLWVNAFKRELDYYSEPDADFLRSIDVLFDWSAAVHESRGRSCRTGFDTFTVDGDGWMRRCHFIPGILGNIYQPGFEAALAPRPCSNDVCRCHIGYVHLEKTGLREIFGDGVLERIPARLEYSAEGKPRYGKSDQTLPCQAGI